MTITDRSSYSKQQESQVEFNRLYNARNPAQGTAKRVLCICSAGLLRSPTAAHTLSEAPFRYNTRAAGIVDSYALIRVDTVLLTWADLIVCMDKEHEEELLMKFPEFAAKPRVQLGIPDSFEYRNSRLVDLIKTRFQERYKDVS